MPLEEVPYSSPRPNSQRAHNTVCSLENYVSDVDRFLGRISPVCGAGSQRRNCAERAEDRLAAQGTADMEDHETRRKIIRQWMALPKDKRQTADQAAAFAKRAVEQNKFQRGSREPYDRIMGWLLSRVGRS